MSEDRERVLHETEGEDTEPDVEAHKLSFNRDEAEKTRHDARMNIERQVVDGPLLSVVLGQPARFDHSDRQARGL